MSKNTTFESAVEQLENTVKLLESGSMSLDESISAFEKAVSLVKICNQKLDSAERKVKLLVECADGSVTSEPFTVAYDET